MTSVSVIGIGKMGAAIAGVAARGGATVQVLARDSEKAAALASELGVNASHGAVGDALSGDIVVLALPYPAISEVLDTYSGQLSGKTLVDISNPVDFQTFDGLVVPADSSAAAEIAAKVSGAQVVKAFNATFAPTLVSGVNGTNTTTVLLAGDDRAAKRALVGVIEAAGLRAIDTGSLTRARDLEAVGFLQIALAASEKTSWTSGFTLLP